MLCQHGVHFCEVHYVKTLRHSGGFLFNVAEWLLYSVYFRSLFFLVNYYVWVYYPAKAESGWEDIVIKMLLYKDME